MNDRIDIDLNASPYYDDFDSSKNYVKILFRPAKSVQARELNQVQTILQNQVSAFGDHVFKDGTIVFGGELTYKPDQHFVRMLNGYNSGNTDQIAINSIDGYLLYANSGVRAVVEKGVLGFESQYPNTNVLYINYITSGKDGSNNDLYTFESADQLYFYNTNQEVLGTLDSNNLLDSMNVVTANATVNAIGTGYLTSIGDGILYQKGFFTEIAPQTVVVKSYDQNLTNYAIGFETEETLISDDEDITLLDNSNGTPNSNAPGAHRLKLTPTLISVDLTTLDSNTSFLPIAEFDDNIPVEENTNTEYNILGDRIAQRTKEESGNYLVKPFSVESLNVSSNSSLMAYAVSPGTGYINGYRVELIGTKKAQTSRATTTEEAQSQIITTSYGNYVIVNEVVGLFDGTTLDTIHIYDTAQNAISDIDGSGSTPSGNAIGTASVRAMKYSSGDRSQPEGEFNLHIFNIKMNSGFSFKDDAKSFYANNVTFGDAKCDIVLENSKAILKDSDKNSLVFDTGLNAVRRLTSALGVNDTQFVFNDAATATLQSNGFITFTTNTPSAGGAERLNASVGPLSELLEEEFFVTLSAPAYSANLTGTITASSNVIVGTGTDFVTDLTVGDYIRVGGTDTRRITSITNTTSAAINSTLTASSANYQRYWEEGHILSNSNDDTEFNIISNTQFSVSTNMGTLDSGSQTVYGQFPILRTQATAKSKDIKKDIFVKIEPNTNSGGLTGPWDLGLIDVNSIEAVYWGTSYSESNPNKKDWFIFDTGQTSSKYGHSTLRIKPNYTDKITALTQLLIKLNHFVANTAAGDGFFSVDSYPLIDDGDTANSTNIAIEDVSMFNNTDVRNLIDFRPQEFSTANSSTTLAGASINPAAANGSFDVTKSLLAIPDSNFQADVEYYLPRYDTISITPSGDIVVKNGKPDVSPKLPFNESDAMVIAEAYVPAYPSLTTRQTEDNEREDLSSSIKLKTIKGYTMKDIGVLDERLDRLEYYVALNSLEQHAKDLTITDTAGLDRFKNGIFANPFNDHAISDTHSPEYSIAIDPENSIARPEFIQRSIEYNYDSTNSSGVQKTGRVISLPYTSSKLITQRFASKYRNCTESVWMWNGDLELYPDYDHFKDVDNKPAIVNNIETGTSTVPRPTFGDWRLMNTRRVWGGTRTTIGRSVTTFSLQKTSDKLELGDYITDISMLPYMRSRVVAFKAVGLKPNSDVYAFFDEVPVSEFCAPGALSGISNPEAGQENTIIARNSTWGTQLRSDSNGDVIGVFRIPENTFRTGERQFVITNVSNLETGADAALTNASALYTANGLAITKQKTVLNVESNKIIPRTTTQILTATVPDAPPRSNSDEDWFRPDNDPIAQSFLAISTASTTGFFIDKIGVYFQGKDNNLGVTCILVEMNGGEPDGSKVIAKKHLTSAEVSISADASVETIFDFDGLHYLQNSSYYAFYIKPDGDSPEYTIWVSEVGGSDISTNEKIFKNPYIGVLYVSSNMNSHTPFQKEDIKFNVYRAKFNTTPGTAIFKNQVEEYITIDGLNKSNSSISPVIGDIVYSADANGTLLTSNIDPVAYVSKVDEGNDKIVLERTNGLFSANDDIQIHREYHGGEVSLNANTLIATATIESIDDLKYSVQVPRFGSIEPSGAKIQYAHKGMNESYVVDSSYYNIVPEIDNEKFDKLRVIPSLSNHSTNSGSEVQITLSSDNSYISPIISLRRKNSILIENIINNSSNNEHTEYGDALTKYISPKITLAEGQDAEDLNVYVTAYKPSGTNILVYVKFKNGADDEEFNNKVWTLMDNGGSGYSATADVNDYIELKYTVPTSEGVTSSAYLNSLNSDIIEYKDSNNAVYVGYKEFAIKIVLLSDNKVVVPRLADTFAIALQV